MRLSEWIRPEAVLTGFQVKDKWEALDFLVNRLVEINLIPKESHQAVRDAILAREKSMSTGMEKGIAIPHAAVDGVAELAIAFGISPGGVPFESIDGKPASILALLVIPRNKKLIHIRTLAEVARLLSQDELRKKILEAPDSAAVIAAIKEAEEKGQT